MEANVIQTEDDILNKHKQERKELQSKIQSLKKSVVRGDRKRKKQVTEEVAKLEEDLNSQQALELQQFKNNSIAEVTHNEDDEKGKEDKSIATTRAQRRRNRKTQEDQDRERRILEQEEKNREGPRIVEMNTIKETLKQLGLRIHNVPADGNCLYCAVNHQLEITGRESFSVAKLRKLTAEYMRENRDDFVPFMYDDSGEPVSEKYFEDYCREVEKTKLWGGQLELKALSNILNCPIKIIQASGPLVQGEQFLRPELILTYHRHLYRLGEHYNSTIAIYNQSGSDADED